jgi:hypothetical protein
VRVVEDRAGDATSTDPIESELERPGFARLYCLHEEMSSLVSGDAYFEIEVRS